MQGYESINVKAENKEESSQKMKRLIMTIINNIGKKIIVPRI